MDNDRMNELKKICFSITSIAKASSALQIADDILPNTFPEANDKCVLIGLFQAVELLGGMASDLVDKMEADSVEDNRANAAMAEYEDLTGDIEVPEYLQKTCSAQKPESTTCPECNAMAVLGHSGYSCLRCFHIFKA